MIKKPMLATDADIKKIKYPCIVQPKIDGVRFMHLIGKPTGRSLKQHKNRHANVFFDAAILSGLDGEMAANIDPSHPDLCRITSSALGTYEGRPFLKWWIFDHIREGVSSDLPYSERYKIAKQCVEYLKFTFPIFEPHIELVPSFNCVSENDLLSLEEDFLELGYEGVIIRDPNGLHKQGRSTIREGGLLRIKRFVEEEAEIVAIIEGETNNNEALTNELGHTYRTSHQANKVGNNMVGSLQGKLLKNVLDPLTKKLLFEAGQLITISPGSLDHNQRKYYYENPNEIIGKISKFKFFPKGMKDKPRFPNHVSFREKEDL
jgi:DNA ligase-1